MGPPLGSKGDRLTWIFCWVLHLVLRVIDLPGYSVGSSTCFEGDRLIYLDVLLDPRLGSEDDRLIYLDVLLGPSLGCEDDE